MISFKRQNHLLHYNLPFKVPHLALDWLVYVSTILPPSRRLILPDRRRAHIEMGKFMGCSQSYLMFRWGESDYKVIFSVFAARVRLQVEEKALAPCPAGRIACGQLYCSFLIWLV